MNEAVVLVLHTTPTTPHAVMSCEQSSISEPSGDLDVRNIERHPISLMQLPNELLTVIVQFIGPPDASRCDPGWHVVPAICRRLRGMASKIPEWTSREVVELENARAALDLYRSHASEWEKAVSEGHWPAHLPPSTFSRCYL